VFFVVPFFCVFLAFRFPKKPNAVTLKSGQNPVDATAYCSYIFSQSRKSGSHRQDFIHATRRMDTLDHKTKG
jgi:hypothetical protein